MTELKPCPFCGVKATLYQDLECGGYYRVGCLYCDMYVNTPIFDNPEEAIEMWNRRIEDMESLTTIISQICDYAADNGLNPTDTVKTVANNLLALCEISNFDNWHKED